MRRNAAHRKDTAMPKTAVPRTLNLVRGGQVLGAIEVKPGEKNQPWHNGDFHPAASFEAVRGLFEQELRLLRANTDNEDAQWEEWEAVHEELHEPGLRLESPDASYIADEILIHIDGGEAWWRND